MNRAAGTILSIMMMVGCAGCRTIEYRSLQIVEEKPVAGRDVPVSVVRQSRTRIVSEQPVIGEPGPARGAGGNAGWVE